MSQQIVSTWDGVQNTNSWVHDGDVERSAVDIVELASSVAGYSAGAQAAADAASGYADTASAAVASIGTAATDAVAAVQDEGTAQISALVDAGGVQSALIGSAGAAQIADIVTSGGVVTSAIADAGSAEIADIVSAGGVQVALVSAAGGSAIGNLAAVTAAQSAALVSAGGYQSGLIATAGSAQITAVQAEGGTQIAAVQLEASAQVNSATVAAMSAGAAASTAQGAASAASGYAMSAGSFAAVTSGYMVSAGGYATSAGSAADAASGYALTASSYMTSAGGYASAASDNADAAAASAASIAGEVEQIGINTKNISTIQSLLNGALSTQQTDATAVYSKSVPAKAQPYAAVQKIGGRTVVWNQLSQPDTTGWNGAGVSASITDGVLYMASATNDTTRKWRLANVPLTIGHVYACVCQCKTDGTASAGCQFRLAVGVPVGDFSPFTTSTSFVQMGAIATITQATYCSVSLNDNTPSGNYANFKDVCLFDLTLMFGAGNEPSTVAEFQQMFPSIDPAYNAGTLISAGVTGAVSVGVNLWDEEWEQGTISNTTGQPDPSGTNRLRSKNFIPCFPNTKYCAYCGGGVTLYTYFYDINKNFIKMGLTTDSNPKIDTSPSNAYFMKFRTQDNYGTTYKNDICINVSDPAINGTYYPYMTQTLPIPAAVQALPGYGWSAGNVYNEVDWERKVYVQAVGSRAYAAGDELDNTVITDKTTTYYPLGTPVETDISALLSDDNLIQVEPGGTMSFPSSLGDNYRLPVPSGVEYTIDMAPDTPSTDGTYTLQCVVADGVPTYSWVSA